MTYWICRHGTTEWNRKKIRQGHKDSPLTEEGLVQAYKLKEVFSDIDGEVYSSPLGRALHTSKIVTDNNDRLKLTVDHRLKEISFGVLEGASKVNISEYQKEIISRFRCDPFGYSFPSGESYYDVFLRAKSFLKNLNTASQNIIIIAHEDVNIILLNIILGLSNDRVKEVIQPNGVIYKITKNMVTNINLQSGLTGKGLLVEKCFDGQ